MIDKRRDGVGRAEQLLVREDPRRLAESTVGMATALAGTSCGAAFAVDGPRLSLVASLGLDQHALDSVHEVWRTSNRTVSSGDIFYSRGPRTFLVAPCLHESEVVGLLYVATSDPLWRMAEDHAALLSGILSRAILSFSNRVASGVSVGDIESYLESTPSDQLERDQLLILLNRHEWNLSRVARLLGVTRMTIYNRLERLSIPRERVPKELRSAKKARS